MVLPPEHRAARNGPLLPRKRGKHQHPRGRRLVARQGGIPGLSLRLPGIRKVGREAGYGGDPRGRLGGDRRDLPDGAGRQGPGRGLRAIPGGIRRPLRRRQFPSPGPDPGAGHRQRVLRYRRIAREKIAGVVLLWPLQYPLSLLVTDRYSASRWIGRVRPVSVLLLHGEGKNGKAGPRERTSPGGSFRESLFIL